MTQAHLDRWADEDEEQLEPWFERAACRETNDDTWFPGDDDRKPSARDVRTAKAVCVTACAVRAECLKSALDNDEAFGIWGGLTEKERRGFAGRNALRHLLEQRRQQALQTAA